MLLAFRLLTTNFISYKICLFHQICWMTSFFKLPIFASVHVFFINCFEQRSDSCFCFEKYSIVKWSFRLCTALSDVRYDISIISLVQPSLTSAENFTESRIIYGVFKLPVKRWTEKQAYTALMYTWSLFTLRKLFT